MAHALIHSVTLAGITQAVNINTEGAGPGTPEHLELEKRRRIQQWSIQRGKESQERAVSYRTCEASVWKRKTLSAVTSAVKWSRKMKATAGSLDMTVRGSSVTLMGVLKPTGWASRQSGSGGSAASLHSSVRCLNVGKGFSFIIVVTASYIVFKHLLSAKFFLRAKH